MLITSIFRILTTDTSANGNTSYMIKINWNIHLNRIGQLLLKEKLLVKTNLKSPSIWVSFPILQKSGIE